jgi:hypothetical protein
VYVTVTVDGDPASWRPRVDGKLPLRTLGSTMSDNAYYAARAATERRMAETATDPEVAAVHWELASRYEKLLDPEQDLDAEAA